jgi:hypothetical protein
VIVMRASVDTSLHALPGAPALQTRRSLRWSWVRCPSRSAATVTAIAMAAMVLLGAAAASAQGLPDGAAVRPEPLPAPTGHRQPREEDLPQRVQRDEGAINPDSDFDKKLGAEICRGC